MSGKKVQKIEKPKPISELVLERLRGDIIANRFALGEKISEAQLSELYGVTKAPIRTAYIRLEGEGLLTIQPQSGTFVFHPTVPELRALCELRIALELEALSLALSRNGELLEKQVDAILKEMAWALDQDNHDFYQQLDTRLHLAIVEHADSPLLAETYFGKVNSCFAALRTRFSREQAHNDYSMAEHKTIAESIRNRDSSQAVRLMREHIDYTEKYYRSLLKDD